jgi:outer membrane protein OmpA-like peptidoglycan-associated protein
MTTFAGAASAQVQTPGFFGSLTGWYYLDSGNDKVAHADNDFLLQPTPDDGWGGRIYAGYRWGTFDVALGFQGTKLPWGKKLSEADDTEVCTESTNDTQDCKAKMKASYWLGDIEVGYNFASGMTGARLFLGARYVNFDHKMKQDGFADDDDFSVDYKSEYKGIGPRIGASVSHRFGNSAFSIFADVSGAVLFGKLKGKYQEQIDESVPDSSIKDKKSRTVWNADGQIGLNWEVAPLVNIGAGYRAEYWNGVAFKTVEDQWGSPDLNASGSGDRFMHGPFVRLTYNIGAPRAMPVAAVAAPPAPAPAPKKNYLVFFDFDRSNITADAQRVIQEAATAAKAGNVARIQLTGHTDRSGSDAYNLALGTRRGDAVKQALIRLGIPAASIAVISRGESQPLVPTADGVREPQNRRVEIML